MAEEVTLAVIVGIGAILASSGFWMFIMKQMERSDATKSMILGLGHDRIVEKGMEYLERGYITQDEYENLKVYLYEPYEEMGGNGSAHRVMVEIDKLPIKRSVLQEMEDDNL